jgi:hypothetical protein
VSLAECDGRFYFNPLLSWVGRVHGFGVLEFEERKLKEQVIKAKTASLQLGALLFVAAVATATFLSGQRPFSVEQYGLRIFFFCLISLIAVGIFLKFLGSFRDKAAFVPVKSISRAARFSDRALVLQLPTLMLSGISLIALPSIGVGIPIAFQISLIIAGIMFLFFIACLADQLHAYFRAGQMIFPNARIGRSLL